MFRARLRQFPSLVTCCTIDWFSEWPKEALISVANTFISEMPEVDAENTNIPGLVSVYRINQFGLHCLNIHNGVINIDN